MLILSSFYFHQVFGILQSSNDFQVDFSPLNQYLTQVTLANLEAEVSVGLKIVTNSVSKKELGKSHSIVIKLFPTFFAWIYDLHSVHGFFEELIRSA